jgi:lipopolysaccharide transport system permease protein
MPKTQWAKKEWQGDILFLLQNLILKDFRIRYRNMSLGVLWSLINPLVMMGVFTFVFGRVFGGQSQAAYPLFVLCGLVPYSFFAGAWSSATNSIVENAGLIKRVPVPREVVPVAVVLSTCLHLLIQLGLLTTVCVIYGYFPTRHWLWLVPIWILYIVFVCGLSLASSAINVLIRDTRYVVDSLNLVLYWLVPIFYSFTIIPEKYIPVYRFNPVAALVMATRNVMMDREPPPMTLILNLIIAASVTLGVGIVIFGRLKHRFYEHI